MTVSVANALYFDPYVELIADPYPPEDSVTMMLIGAADRDHRRLPPDGDVECDVDLADAKLSPTATVRGWETMPAVLR